MGSPSAGTNNSIAAQIIQSKPSTMREAIVRQRPVVRRAVPQTTQRRVAPEPRYYSSPNVAEPSWVRQQRLERSMGVSRQTTPPKAKIATSPTSGFSSKCVAVIDGDTLKVSHPGGMQTIQLHTIDAPELLQPFGLQAKDSLSSMALNQTLTIYPVGRGKQGHTLAWVFLGSNSLNRVQVEKGYAWWNRQDKQHEAKIGGLENAARAAKSGLWSDATSISPWEWREKQN